VVDEEGNVHFSDTPPENVVSEKVQVDDAPSPGDGSADRHSPRKTIEDAGAEVKRYCDGGD
jgi:hypothetical protein